MNGRLLSWGLKALVYFLLLFISIPKIFAGISFEPNKGQWDSRVLYKAEIPGGFFYLTDEGIIYHFVDENAIHEYFHEHKQLTSYLNHVVSLKFPGSNKITQVSESDNYGTYSNYFLGNDPSKWASKVGSFGTLTIHDLWKGIDLEITARGNSIKYNFILAPRSAPSLIKMQYEGAEDVIVKNDSLRVYTSLTNIIEGKPYVYQACEDDPSGYKQVKAGFNYRDGLVSFNLGRYNHHKKLIIDPIVVFATFSGSVADNWGFTATYNNNGEAFSGGTVYSTGYPTSTGAYQKNFRGGVTVDNTEDIGRDCGIIKYSADGKQRMWATYLGGSNNEQPHSMVVNSQGELVIFGTTRSSDFPVTSNAFDRGYNGGGDIFISILSADGSNMIASTFLGGSNKDGLNGTAPFDYQFSEIAYNYGDEFRGEVIVDNDDNIFITSTTFSTDYPVINSFQSSKSGSQDACVTKLDRSLSKILWSTYLGGRGEDAGYGIHLDSKGNVFVCGGTISSNFPTTGNTWHSSFQGNVDGYLCKFSPDGRTMLASTFVGTGDYDQAFFVQTDDMDRIYVTGQTLGSFPVANGVYSNRGGKQFIAVFNDDLSFLLRSTVFGSGRETVDLSPSAFLVDLCGRVYVCGWGGRVNHDYYNVETGYTNGLPITGDAYQKVTDGSDFYLIILSRDLTDLVYATYFGGISGSLEHVDGGTSRFDRDGKVYESVCGGCGGFSDFPTTPGAWSRTNNGRRPSPPYEGGCNNALFKIDLNSSNFAPEFLDTVIQINIGDVLDYSFDITDADKNDSVFAYYSGNLLDPKQVNNPTAKLTADTAGIKVLHGSLHWEPGCIHATGDTFYLNVIAHDNGCPTPRVTKGHIKIVVKVPPIPKPPSMFCLERRNEHSIELIWRGFTVNKYLKDFKLVKRFPDGHDEIVKTISSLNDNTYFDDQVPDHMHINYCYFMYGTSICGKNSDTTYMTCTTDMDSVPPPVDMFAATVEDNKYVKVTWHLYSKKNFHDYSLYRRLNKSTSNYELYRTFSTAADTSFIDSAVDVQHNSYVYKISTRNQCLYSSWDGRDAVSILLTGNSIPFENHLSWNPYHNWKNGVDHYNVFRLDPSKGDSLIAVLPGNKTIYFDTSLNYDEGIYWYHVVAYEHEGDSAISVSNTLELVQAPYLRVPNAFTPNGDNLNDVWNLIPVFVKDYHLKIFNGWGEFVWETSDRHVKWDGLFNQGKPFNNVFIWQVDYTGWDKSHHFQHGNVTVLQ